MANTIEPSMCSGDAAGCQITLTTYYWAASQYNIRRCSLLLLIEYRGLSVCHTSEPCENGWTDRDAVCVEDSGCPRELCIRWRFRSPMGRDNFWREGAYLCKV